MRVLGWLFLAAMALSILRAAIAVFLLLLIVSLAIALARNPVKTLTMFAGIIMLNALAANPAVGGVLIGLVIFVTWLAPQRDRKR